MTLAEFILMRIAEDEAVANVCTAWDDSRSTLREGGRYVEASPARVLAECEAKRQIVAERLFHDRDPDYELTILGARILGALALPYADHPDYDESWRP